MPVAFRLILVTAGLCLATAACAPSQSHNANSLADEHIGIVQCDQYLARISACIHRAPAGQHAVLTAQARETFATWKEAAAHPQHRETLPQACSVTTDLAREELAPLGCQFEPASTSFHRARQAQARLRSSPRCRRSGPPAPHC